MEATQSAIGQWIITPSAECRGPLFDRPAASCVRKAAGEKCFLSQNNNNTHTYSHAMTAFFRTLRCAHTSKLCVRCANAKHAVQARLPSGQFKKASAIPSECVPCGKYVTTIARFCPNPCDIIVRGLFLSVRGATGLTGCRSAPRKCAESRGSDDKNRR